MESVTGSMSRQAPAFLLEEVGRRWGNQTAINKLSLEIRPGEKVALIGPSGGGKSTLIRMLAGALRPTSGRVCVDEYNIGKFSPKELRRHRARCRIVEQTHLLVPQLTVHQNTIAGQLPCWPWYKITAAALWPLEKKRVHSLLQSLGIAEHQWRLTGELSGGQMQRVAVARALISEPAALLADEPTASLDPTTAKAVTQLILSEARARGVTLVFCTHWLQIILKQCDRVIGLRQGSLVLDAKPSEVAQDALDYLYEGSHERV